MQVSVTGPADATGLTQPETIGMVSAMDLGNVQTAVQSAVQSAVQTALSYWVGALSEPVLMITPQEMARARGEGAVIWDVRTAAEYQQGLEEDDLWLGSVDWLLADNCGGNLVPAPVIAQTLESNGIKPGRMVIVYAQSRAVDAFVALRALRSIGIHDARVCLGSAQTAGPAPVRSARTGHGALHPSDQQVDLAQVY